MTNICFTRLIKILVCLIYFTNTYPFFYCSHCPCNRYDKYTLSLRMCRVQNTHSDRNLVSVLPFYPLSFWICRLCTVVPYWHGNRQQIERHPWSKKLFVENIKRIICFSSLAHIYFFTIFRNAFANNSLTPVYPTSATWSLNTPCIKWKIWIIW